MDQMEVERLIYKNPYQALTVELKEEYGMSSIEVKALVKKMQESFGELILMVGLKIKSYMALRLTQKHL